MSQGPNDAYDIPNPEYQYINTEPSPSPRTTRQRIHQFIVDECTFYRVHLTAFVIVPLIASGIFYASNGRYHVKYLDALFLCYSAMTVTGLTAVNLSTLTPWQQVMIYFLMIIGDITTISWIMVLVRKRFFRNHCEYIMREIRKKKGPRRTRSELIQSIKQPRWISYTPKAPQEGDPRSAPVDGTDSTAHDPSDESTTPVITSAPPLITTTGPTPGPTMLSPVEGPGILLNDTNGLTNRRRTNEAGKELRVGVEELSSDAFFSASASDGTRWTSSPTQTGPISLPPVDSGTPHVGFALATGVEPRRNEGIYRAFNLSADQVPLPRRTLTLSNPRQRTNPGLPGTPQPTAVSGTSSKYHGLGQFPGPFQIMQRLAKRAAPKTYKKLKRSMTLPASRTLESRNTSYLNFDLTTSRNSDFHVESLNDDELEELGGTEYRALRWLTYVVPLYFFGTQILAFTIFSPWISTSTQYNAVFEAQPRLVNKTWFSLFQVMAAYTGGGLSLVDQGMLPFQTAYLMIFPMMFVIVAGNHAMPIFLRLVIWILSKIVREGSEDHAALSFLLDHPRRCFLYLFPSHQTWFLLISLVLFSIEWIAFAVLNNGLSAYEALPVGVRVVGGLFQGIAARASGFSIVPLSNLAPALLFLYVVMMYIAVYPIAMSIRSTNVYEERSLGVYEFEPENEFQEPQGLEKIKDRRERIGKYLYWHFRRQMSIDIWWLVWGVFCIAIVERHNLMDEDKKWFDLFRIIFELVSAFGGIGLSLGFPSDNFSFAGAMRPLSKLIIIVIMVRGRHRGLPVAVDRAIVLPREMVPPSQRTGSKVALNEKTGTTAQEPQHLYSDFGASHA